MQDFQGRYFDLLQHWNDFRYILLKVTNTPEQENVNTKVEVHQGRDYFALMLNKNFDNCKRTDNLTNEGTLEYFFKDLYYDDLKD